MWSVSRPQTAYPARLLRRVVEQPAHLRRGQSRNAPGGGSRSECPRKRVRAAPTLVPERRAAERHREAWTHVVPECHRSQIVLAADAELLAERKRRRHNRRARMRLRRPVGIVGFVRMSEDAVDQRRIHRPGQDGRADDRRRGTTRLLPAPTRARHGPAATPIQTASRRTCRGCDAWPFRRRREAAQNPWPPPCSH